VPNVARFDADTLKIQRMIKWDFFWDTVYVAVKGLTADTCAWSTIEDDTFRWLDAHLLVVLWVS